MFVRRILISILFVIISFCSYGQVVDTISTASPKQELSKAEKDSIINAKLSTPSTIIQDNTKTNNSISQKQTHSPLKASLYSTFVPGLGQIYNRQVWKVPIIYAAEGALLYLAITNYRGAQRFKDEYLLRSNNIVEGRNPEYVNFPDQSIYNLYYAYQKNFELTIVAGAIIYILNIVDAMVYAHLFDFDISPNLSMNLTPYYLPTSFSPNYSPTFGLSMRFNLR
ncbi:MAG: DUF5683 domain-containing protein [Bacteroidales bacterium]|jgi:hypothetical protein|nr:DUF5683 domain-containing protein [Bacteroidales bacterium]MDD4702699.1 DUF5683 domain-containing protein [Bacteroidales bacterium]MDX9797251.1 DUF5683 domain-containing protein [Bacteroidales bacterium]